MELKPEPVAIRTETIGLAKFLKLAGVASTGGEASSLIRQGEVKVNGLVVTRRAKSLHPGNVVSVDQHHYIVEVDRSVDGQTPQAD